MIAVTIICTKPSKIKTHVRPRVCLFDHKQVYVVFLVECIGVHHSLVPARCALARVLGLPAETQGLGAAEGGRCPHLLLPLAVDAL